MSKVFLDITKKKQSKRVVWTPLETEKLMKFVKLIGEKWTRVAEKLKNRSDKQCMQKYNSIAKIKKRGRWSTYEDEKVRSWVQINGPLKWSECARTVTGRSGKQCRERWMNTLNPNIKKSEWDIKEQLLLFKELSMKLSSWASISKKIKGRTENRIKNFVQASFRKIKQNRCYSFLQAVLFEATEFMFKGKNIF